MCAAMSVEPEPPLRSSAVPEDDRHLDLTPHRVYGYGLRSSAVPKDDRHSHGGTAR